MNKKLPYDELAAIIARRSTCNVQVGAVIYDKDGIFSWGWNHSGPDGFGMHAEAHAVKRANKKRLVNASIVVVAFRKKKQITSTPCPKCAVLLGKKGIKKVTAAKFDGEWLTYKL